MREILFKAKRLDNGQWVQGCLIKHEFDGHFRSTPPDGFCNNFEPKEEPNNEN